MESDVGLISGRVSGLLDGSKDVWHRPSLE
jgi:hypothetical protein